MGRKVVPNPQGSTERVRRFRKRQALIESITAIVYSTSDNDSLESIQAVLDSIHEETTQNE